MRILLKASGKISTLPDTFWYIKWLPKLYQSQQNRANCPICSADSTNDHTNFRRSRQPEQLRLVQESFQRQDKEPEWLPHTRHFLPISRIQVNKYKQHLSYEDFVHINIYIVQLQLWGLYVRYQIPTSRKKS